VDTIVMVLTRPDCQGGRGHGHDEGDQVHDLDQYVYELDQYVYEHEPGMPSDG
jgi:hypothetical protein